MKYRKKPIIIEAFQYGYEEIPDWCLKNESCVHFTGYSMDYILINTLEGEMKAVPGDYVIKGIKGEIYPVKYDIFEASYEKVIE